MAVRFLLGPAGSGKTHACFEALREHERRREPAIYLVPEQFTYSADRELLETADLPGLRHVRVFSFSRLAWWIRERAGTAPLATLDEAARTMLLRALLDGMDPADLGPLAAMRHRTGVLQQLSRFIGEVRNHGPQSFLEGIERARETERGRAAPRGVLAKLETLARIYERYTGQLAALGRADPEERLRGLEPLIARDAAFLATMHGYVDGFLSWTRREADVLVSLASAGAELSIALCCDPRERDDPRVPFRPVFRSLERLEERLRRARVPIEPAVTFASGRRFDNPTLARIERQIYANDPLRIESSLEDPARVELLEARDRRQEVTSWARRIDRWLRLDGMASSRRATGSSDGRDRVSSRSAATSIDGPESPLGPAAPGEIAVLLRDVEPYRDLVREIFARYDIPFFLDERRSVLAHPEARLLLGALEIALSDWRRDAVIAFLRNPLLGVPLPLVDVLENRSREFGRDFEHWYSDRWEDYIHPARASFHDPSKDPLPEAPSPGEEDTDLAEESETEPGDLPFVSSSPRGLAATAVAARPAAAAGSTSTSITASTTPSTTTSTTAASNGHAHATASAPEIERTEAIRLEILCPLQQLFDRWRRENWTGARAAGEITSFLKSRRSVAGESGDDGAAAPVGNDQLGGASGAAPEDDLDEPIREALQRLLADAGSMWRDVAVSIEEFARSIREGLLTLRLGVTPMRMDQVLVGDVQRSRVLGIRHAVIGGVNEGMFPRSIGDDPILNERDRAALADLGVPLGPTALERQEEEAYLFYIALTRAAESMLVTWSATDALGKETPPSLATQDLLAILGDPPVHASPEPVELTGVQSPRELGRHLLSHLAAWMDRPPAEEAGTTPRVAAGLTLPAVLELVTGAPAEPWVIRTLEGAASPNEVRALRTAQTEIEHGGAILRRPELWLPPDLLSVAFEGQVVESSVSRLQEFAGCPFQSFARSLLRLELRPEAKVSPLETGTLAHAALEHVFEDLPERIPDLSRRLREVFDALEPLPDFHGFRVDEASRYRWSSTQRALLRFLYLETERLRASPYQVLARELRFGMGDPGLEIPLPDGLRLRIRGQIDRVDRHRDDRDAEHPRALVIDYKRSARSGLPRGLEEGADLQLAAYMLYLRDVRGLDPVAGLYVPVVPSPKRAELRGSARNRLGLQAHGVFLKDEAAAIDGGVEFLISRGPQHLADRGARDRLLDRARDYLASFAATQRRGWIEPRPLLRESKRPCERCDYAAVCRFRREIDPDRRSAMEGMVAVASKESGP